jgi:hypothetical protein
MTVARIKSAQKLFALKYPYTSLKVNDSFNLQLKTVVFLSAISTVYCSTALHTVYAKQNSFQPFKAQW